MKFPTLVPNKVCTSDCAIYRTEGLNLDGSKKQVEIYSGKCFHSMKTNQKLNAEKQLITLLGEALFNGDITPNAILTDGTAQIDGTDYKIYSSEKAKNPDGTVNYTRLLLI